MTRLRKKIPGVREEYKGREPQPPVQPNQGQWTRFVDDRYDQDRPLFSESSGGYGLRPLTPEDKVPDSDPVDVPLVHGLGLSPEHYRDDLDERPETVTGNPLPSSFSSVVDVRNDSKQQQQQQETSNAAAVNELMTQLLHAYGMPSTIYQAAPTINTNASESRTSSSQNPAHGEQPSSSSGVFQYEFPEAANVIRKILSDSNLQTYRLEERFVLLLTFAVTRGIMCTASDFSFPKLFIDMIDLWNAQEPDGFRVIISALQNNTLVMPPEASPEEKKEIAPEPRQSTGLGVLDDSDIPVMNTEADTSDLPTTQEYEAEQESVFALTPINEATEDADVTVQEEQQLQATTSEEKGESKTEEQNIDDAVEQFSDPRDRQAWDSPVEEPNDESEIQTGHAELVRRDRESMKNTAKNIRTMHQEYRDAQAEYFDIEDNDEVQIDADESHVAHVTQRFEATPSEPLSDSHSSGRRQRRTRVRNQVNEINDNSDDEPILQRPVRPDNSRRPSSPSPISAPVTESLSAESPARGEANSRGGRPRAYNSLRVDNQSAWATRAAQRAEYWTKRLAEMKEQGLITEDDWDGRPITPEQWNNRRGSTVLRDLFKRDRLVEYQAYRRDTQKQTNEREGIQIRDNVPAPPFDKKGRKGRGIANKKRTAKVIQATPSSYKAVPIRLDDIIDFGKSSPAASARQVMNQMNMAKVTRKGRGLLQKQFHIFIVSPKSVAWVNSDSGAAHYLSTMTAKITLMTYLFLVNPRYGEAIRPGLSELIYQLGFEDIFNLFRLQPQFIPSKYADLFSGGPRTSTRWNKTGQPRRFASFVDQWMKKAAERPDELKIAILLLNGLIQLQLVDNLHSSIEMGGRVKTAPPAFNEDGVSGTVALVSNLGIDIGDILTLQTDIKASFQQNIDYFMSHAAHRLYARQES